MTTAIQRGANLSAFSHATVGVANLATAVSFWQDNFGFEVAARRDGPDAGLATLWGLKAADITRQALVRTQTARAGWLHLVEFARPAAPVRQGVQVFDHLPKNLDIYTKDMDRRFEELSALGVQFRGRPITSPGPAGLTFKEVHLAGHDETNVVLLEIIGPGYDTCFNARGFAGIGPLITIVGSLEMEEDFYQGVLGMEMTLDIRLGGPVMEKMIGLPAGAALLLKVYGDPDELLGRIEVIEYQQTRGSNLFERARPPALGTLHVNYQVPNLRGLRKRLRLAGVGATEHGDLDLLYGQGPILSFKSPAGFRIEVQERHGASVRQSEPCIIAN